MILKNYLRDNELQYSDRNTICTIIADYWIDCKHQVISSTYREAFLEIKKLFPSEDEVCYFSLKKKQFKF